ncbi:MAG: biotin--[acetyl-CoA-carboxylase] ligase [Thermotogota bacterium]|nr:biotin--[acetyl-CoA-carboxylase] ligase [Thermotogota bacterium]
MHIGDRIEAFTELESTNTYALNNAEKIPSGGVIWALKQSSGYGRFRRKWISPQGGLWFSIVFKPRKIKDFSFYLRLSSVAIVETLIQIEAKLKIKWPNDIVQNGKKLGGILTESLSDAKKINVIVVGIGLNINNSIPKVLSEKAISLKNIINREISLSYLLDKIIKKMDRLYSRYSKPENHRYLTRKWKKYLMNKVNDNISITLPSGKILSGRITDIKPSYLTVLTETNESKKIYAGEFNC